MNTSSTIHQCKHCHKKYKVIAALKKHEEVCSHMSETKSLQETEGEEQNTCKECGQTFKYAKILQRHEAMHKGKSPYWCKLCMTNFFTYEEKVLHKMNEHPNKGKKRTCKLCPDINFSSEEEYLYHITELHKGKFDDYYMCSDCGKQFKTKSELTHHNNSKCGTIKQYKCKVCSQDLMTAGSLHNHMLRHTGERCCMCGYCGKMFLTTGQLKVHERTHTQEKAFVCNVCGKGFCHRQSLITHSTLHTGIKPYQCDNCLHSFSCVGNLIKHRRTHVDTCGATPLTTHRVNNPSTKMKVKINTPKNSKLKALRKEKELQEKLDAYKKKLVREPACDGSQHASDKNRRQNGNLGCDFDEKTDGLVIDDVPYIPNGFLQTKVLELDSSLQLSNVPDQMPHENCMKVTHEPSCMPEIFNNLDHNLLEYQNKFTINDKEKIADSIDFVPENPADYLSNLHNGVPFEDSFNTQNDADKKEDSYDGDKNGCYDSDACDSVKAEQAESAKSKRTTKQNKSNKQEKISEDDYDEFIKQRGFDGETEGICKYCKKGYTNLRWLFKHEKEHEKKSHRTEIKSSHLYKCSCCKNGFTTRDECRTHQQNMHADVLTCQDCDKLFSNMDSLRSHQNIFHKGLPRKVYVYVCEKCGLQFRQKAFLTHHENSNCGTGPVYECHVCGKGFNSAHTRRSHLRIHDPKKRFLCKFCGKSFRWKGQLKIHERSHTGEKPFKCLYCPKAFAYRESLITHSSLHTGVKPHLCQACGSRFSCIGNLIKHRGTHATTCGAWYSKNQ